MRGIGGSIAVVIALGAPVCADAQLLRGHVLERDGRSPIVDAVVTVYDSAGLASAAVRTRDDGAFTLRSPVGRVQVHARRLGYAPKATPWIEVAYGDTIALELDVDRAVIVLTPEVIAAERDEIVNTRLTLGLDPRSIVGSIITPTMIAVRAASARNYIDVLAGQGLAWARGSEKCMWYPRNSMMGQQACISVYVDGIRLANGGDDAHLKMARDVINPSDIDYIVILRPAEAGVLFGTGSENGVILIYTKHGNAGRKRD